ncbi:RNA-directed DNA polymerase, eukaryota [Tanacetum coccineum]
MVNEHVSKPSFARAVKGNGTQDFLEVPVMVLESGSLNFKGDPVLVGCVKDFKTIPNIQNVCSSEGFKGIKTSYLGGFWVLFEFDYFKSCEKFQSHYGINLWFLCLQQWDTNFVISDRVVWIDVEGTPLHAWSLPTFNKIASKWGELVYMDDSNVTNKYSMRLCVKTKIQHLIAESFKVILRGKVYVVRAKEVTGWVPDFGEQKYIQSEDGSDNHSVGIPNWVDADAEDEEVVPNSFQSNDNEDISKGNVQEQKNDSEPQFPPGFTPLNSVHSEKEAASNSSPTAKQDTSHQPNTSNLVDVDNTDQEAKITSGGSNNDHVDSMAPSPKPINGFSILEQFQEFINIGQAMGYGLGGKEKKQWVKNLCQSNQLVVDQVASYVFGIKLFFKRRELSLLVIVFVLKVVLMGDFNEVRSSAERFGSTFHALNAVEFNAFISNNQLVDVPLGGYSFTWS